MFSSQNIDTVKTVKDPKNNKNQQKRIYFFLLVGKTLFTGQKLLVRVLCFFLNRDESISEKNKKCK